MTPFVVVEGIDGSGKGTQANLLLERLKELGRDAVLTREPTNGAVGKLIREHMQNPFLDDKSLALLFAADRIEHIEKEVIPNLEKGRVVISDRYVYSSIAYQGQTLDPDWVASINDHALRPDAVVLIDMDPQVSLKRVQERDESMEYFEMDMRFQEGVRKTFQSLSKGHHLPESLKTDFIVVRGEGIRKEVFERIWDKLERHVMG
ncbi:MAG: dTMP kinase [Candidatus Thermoplasmatota archaeon]|nr:dTMP kinase [Candidatus Thermoplasmatota archaeon]